MEAYLILYNTKRPDQGRKMNGRTPAEVFIKGLPKPKNQKEGQNEKAA